MTNQSSRTPGPIAFLACGLLAYAVSLLLFDVVPTALRLLAAVANDVTIKELVGESDSAVPDAVGYVVSAWNCVLILLLTVSVAGMFAAERWALRLARIALLCDLVSLLAVLLLTSVSMNGGSESTLQETTMALLEKTSGICCCGGLPLLLFLACAAPATRELYERYAAGALAAPAGQPTAPPAPPTIAAPPPPAPPAPPLSSGEVWRPPEE